MFGTGIIKNLLDTLNVSSCPFAVWFAQDLETDVIDNSSKRGMPAKYLAKVGEDNDGTNKENGFLVDNVEFIGDGGSENASSEESSTGLGDETGLRGKFLNDFIGALGGRRGCEATAALTSINSFPMANRNNNGHMNRGSNGPRAD
jgi:hypothetical protein